jgi:hypothetical protein
MSVLGELVPEPEWWNGRHAGFRCRCPRACGFESRLWHTNCAYLRHKTYQAKPPLLTLAMRDTVTLLTATRDVDHSQAAVLARLLRETR